MSQSVRTLRASPEPLPLSENVPAFSRRANTLRRVGRLRIPIAGPYRPWATLYRLPDGRPLWCLRLWEIDRPVSRCVTTERLLAFADRSRLDGLRGAILELAGRADTPDASR